MHFIRALHLLIAISIAQVADDFAVMLARFLYLAWIDLGRLVASIIMHGILQFKCQYV